MTAFRWASILFVTMAFGGAGPAHAAAAANDDFASAEALSGATATATGSNFDATGETGEPDHAAHSIPMASVWYSWTPATTGRVRIDTCGSAIDTTLGVYTGTSVDALNPVASNDDDPRGTCGTAGAVWFEASAGTPYKIAVDGSGYAEGDYSLSVAPAPRPANDDFASPELLSGGSPTATGTNVNATGEPGEPDHAFASSPLASVWFEWTPMETGWMSAATCSSGFDTTLAVYTGDSVDALTQVASNDDGDGACGLGSALRFLAHAGTTYRIAVAGFEGREGRINLAVFPAPPPGNDNFADAVTLPGIETTDTGTTVNATGEPGEPDHAEASAPLASVWYRWTARADGPASVDTCGSGFDTTLGVYTGSAVSSLAQVAANDQACGDASATAFYAHAGTTYSIAVDGVENDTGHHVLHVRGTALPTPGPPVLPATGSSPTLGDTTAPAARLAGAANQKLGKTVSVTVTCGRAEDCLVAATGGLTVPGAARVYPLAPARASVPRGTKATLRLKIPRKGRTAATRALRRGKRVRANVGVTVADASGNTRALKRTIRIRR
jgi:hypothetical protein